MGPTGAAAPEFEGQAEQAFSPIIGRSLRASCSDCGRAVRGGTYPERFGPWQTAWKRHARFSKDGTWDQILAALLVTADQAGHVDWQLSIDSTVCRVHQHGLNMTREVAAVLPSHTGGRIELQETTR